MRADLGVGLVDLAMGCREYEVKALEMSDKKKTILQRVLNGANVESHVWPHQALRDEQG